jgi:hypothetical protein
MHIVHCSSMTVAGAKLFLLDLLKTIIQNIANINNIYKYNLWRDSRGL